MRFSVVTSTRNREDWLQGAVESVRRQTFTDYEHVIYDVSDSPIRPIAGARIVRGECRGMAEDWNQAVKQARGEIVMMLSDDDRFPRHAIETVNKHINDHPWLVGKTVLVKDGYPIHYRGGTVESLEQTLNGRYMLGGGIAYRPEFIWEVGGFNDEYEGAADVDLYIRMARHTTPVIIPDVIYIYTDHPETDSRVRAEHQAIQTGRVYERAS